jgi:hypothetical protein
MIDTSLFSFEETIPHVRHTDLTVVSAGLSVSSQVVRHQATSIEAGALKNVPAAAFDTRYRMSRFLRGSAAARIASRLKRAGARLVVPPASFFMERDVPSQGEKRRHEMERLEPGEEGRATQWAASILEGWGRHVNLVQCRKR